MTAKKSDAEKALTKLRLLRPQINQAVEKKNNLFRRQNELYLKAYQAGASIRQIAEAVGLEDQYEAVRQAVRKMERENSEVGS